jgi:DNA mismatch endonuclease (patch repair protein)
MTDVHNQAQRRRNMSAIRSKNTRPEMLIRRGLHARGFRYSLHHRKLPGHPDMVLKKHRAVIFVHGCFWHGHQCPLFRWPASRREFWTAKILRNRAVDARSVEDLRRAGWRILTIWECALKGKGKRELEDVLDRTDAWLRSGRGHMDIEGLS